jgi:hypothetical protein
LTTTGDLYTCESRTNFDTIINRQQKESEKASEGKPVEKLSGEKPSEQPQPKPKPKLGGSIVAIVGEMAIRMSFSSRGRERREWQRSGLTRTSTTLPMVYLSLVCRCQGQGECEDSSGLGREIGCWRCCCPAYTSQTGEGHRSDRCRPGQAAVRVSCSCRCEVCFWRSWFW